MTQLAKAVSSIFRMRWITNIKEGYVDSDGSGNCGNAVGAICITCERKMPGIWDTVCASCGGTSCYDHSQVIEGHWFCVKCTAAGSIAVRWSDLLSCTRFGVEK